MVVNEIPSPALVVGAEEGDVAVALVRCLLCRDPDDGDGAQRPLPNNLPRVTTAGETRLAACPIGALYMYMMLSWFAPMLCGLLRLGLIYFSIANEHKASFSCATGLR